MDDEPMFGLTFTQSSVFWCGTKYFLRYYGKFVSCWLTVAITIERYVLIALPLKASTLSTKRVTSITIAAIYVIGAALFAFPYWELEIKEYKDDCTEYEYCSYKDWHKYTIYNWVLIKIGSLILPCSLIFIFTIIIVVNLRANQRERRELEIEVSEVKAVEKQLTLMLIVVAVATLVLRLPYTIVYMITNNASEFWGDDFQGSWSEFRLYVLQDVTYVFMTVNYMINFFLFCFTGSIFRQNLKNCLLGRWRSKETVTYQSDYTKATSFRSNSNSMTSLHHLKKGSSNMSVNVGRLSVTPQGTPRTLRAQQETPLLKRNEKT